MIHLIPSTKETIIFFKIMFSDFLNVASNGNKRCYQTNSLKKSNLTTNTAMLVSLESVLGFLLEIKGSKIIYIDIWFKPCASIFSISVRR